MKNNLLFFIFLVGIGFFAGRWSLVSNSELNSSNKIADLAVTSQKSESCSQPQPKQRIVIKTVETKCAPFMSSKMDRFHRTPKNSIAKKMQRLKGRLFEALQTDNIEKQNQVFREMIETDPRHIHTYEAKVLFLRQDGDFKGIRTILKECVTDHPDNISCHRQLSNVRTATPEEVKTHGERCLELDPDNGSCLVDLAFHYRQYGNFERSIQLLQKAIQVRETSKQGYSKDYLYWHYGSTLEMAQNFEAADDAYAKACEFNHKLACEKLEGQRKRSS